MASLEDAWLGAVVDRTGPKMTKAEAVLILKRVEEERSRAKVPRDEEVERARREAGKRLMALVRDHQERNDEAMDVAMRRALRLRFGDDDPALELRLLAVKVASNLPSPAEYSLRYQMEIAPGLNKLPLGTRRCVECGTEFAPTNPGPRATDPEGGLSLEVLGIQPTLPAGQAYQVIPHAGDLTHVEGRLALSPGHPVNVSYDHPACSDFTLHVDSSGASGYTGIIGMPKFGQTRTIQINGVTAWDGSQAVPDAGVGSVSEDDSYIYFGGISPSVLTFTYYPRCP